MTSMDAFSRLFGVFWKRAFKGYDDINRGFAQQDAIEIMLHFTGVSLRDGRHL